MSETIDIRLRVYQQADVSMARLYVREVAREAGLAHTATEAMATAVSEVAQNIIVHAGRGEISVKLVARAGMLGVAAIATDNGPGIPDQQRAFQDGYSTAHGLGLGLSSARRLVDDFEIISAVGKGTTITLKKWSS